MRCQARAIDLHAILKRYLGYARLVLLILAYSQSGKPRTFLPIYLFSILLDFFDGWSARALDQCSTFGAWVRNLYRSRRNTLNLNSSNFIASVYKIYRYIYVSLLLIFQRVLFP